MLVLDILLTLPRFRRVLVAGLILDTRVPRVRACNRNAELSLLVRLLLRYVWSMLQPREIILGTSSRG